MYLSDEKLKTIGHLHLMYVLAEGKYPTHRVGVLSGFDQQCGKNTLAQYSFQFTLLCASCQFYDMPNYDGEMQGFLMI